MATNWVPPDITNACAEATAPLTQCSQTGFMFLTLVSRLFGGSIDNQIKYPKVNPYALDYTPSYADISSDYGETGPLIDRPVSVNTQVASTFTNYEKELGKQVQLGSLTEQATNIRDIPTTNQNSEWYPGSKGYEDANYYTGPDFEFEPDTFANPFAKYYSNSLRSFGKRSFSDSDSANSKKSSVRTKQLGKSEKRRRKRHAREVYDFIIVGAGSAGCVIANRLSEVKKWKILLIEAGPEEPDVTSVPSFAPTLGRSSIDWMYRTQPEELTCRAQLGQTCAWLSGRVMGGSSSINYLVYMRGNKKDYDDWATLGNKGWSYKDVLPYFTKSENNRDIEANDKRYHGVGGYLTVERFANIDKNVPLLISAFNEAGLPLVDFNGESQMGTMTTQTTSQDGQRMSTNVAFIRPIRLERKNLRILTNAQVVNIDIDEINHKAYGVTYLKNGVLKKAFVKKEVIISAGALNSPKILLLSGIGPKEQLQSLQIPVIKNLKVGHNLQDHTTVDAFLMKLSNKTSTMINKSQILSEILRFSKSKYRDGLLAATGPLQITAFIRTKYADNDESVPDIQYHFDGRNANDFYSDPTHYLALNNFPLAYYDSINVRPVLLSPKSRGYLTLNRTNPFSGQPLIYPNFFTDKRDLDTLIEALKFAVKLENTKAFKNNEVEFIRIPVKACSTHKWGSYDYFSCILTSYTATIFHPAGTCKMGPKSDKNAVVDHRLKVYGINNLRVADASIMPKIVRGNTNAPVIMIGEKVSDMIKQDWNHAT